MGLRRALTVGAILVAVLAAPASASRSQDSTSGLLEVERGSLIAPLHFSVRTAYSAGLPSRIELDVPAGYSMKLGESRGTHVGAAGFFLFDMSSSGAAFGNLDLAVDDPAAYANDPVAQDCAPGAHANLWSGTSTVGGQTLRLLVFVDPATSGGDTLVLCPSGLSGSSPISTNVDLVVGVPLTAPTTAGTFVWRAFVTPRTGNRYELRAIDVLPSAVTLNSTYDAKRKQAVLSGRATVGGKPLAHDEIYVDEQVGNVVSSDSRADAKTSADGRFTARKPIGQTTDYIAHVDLPSQACASPSTAPGGCVSQTAVAPPPGFATVFVSRSNDPRRAYTSSAQNRARAEQLRATDLPAGSAAAGPGAHTCDRTHAPETRLTINGEVQSPSYAAGASVTAVSSTTRVYRSPADAKAALTAEAGKAVKTCLLGALGARGAVKEETKAFAQHPATVRAFVGTIHVIGPATSAVELVFVQRGRSLAKLLLIGDEAQRHPLALKLARALAARIR